MTATRQEAYLALFAVVSNAYAWASPPSRRLKLWGDVPLNQQPALFQAENEPDAYRYRNQAGTLSDQQRVIHARLFCYFDAKDPSLVGADQLNAALDAFDAAFTPASGEDAQTGLFSLGGLVYSCRIAGVPLRDPGDIDGQALLIVNVEMVLP